MVRAKARVRFFVSYQVRPSTEYQAKNFHNGQRHRLARALAFGVVVVVVGLYILIWW